MSLQGCSHGGSNTEREQSSGVETTPVPSSIDRSQTGFRRVGFEEGGAHTRTQPLEGGVLQSGAHEGAQLGACALERRVVRQRAQPSVELREHVPAR
jgi:hypothetical protein